MAITIQDLFTRSMVITMPGAETQLTRVSYIDNEDNTWDETFDIEGDLYIHDIMPQTRSVSRSTPTTRAAADYTGPWITAISCAPQVTSIAFKEDIVSSQDEAIKLLEEISAPNVTSIGEGVFSGTKLTSISLPNVTEVGMGAFKGCYDLQTISLPKVTSIGQEAFDECSSLSLLVLTSLDREEVAKSISSWGIQTPNIIQFEGEDVPIPIVEYYFVHDSNNCLDTTTNASTPGAKSYDEFLQEQYDSIYFLDNDARALADDLFNLTMKSDLTCPSRVMFSNATTVGDNAFKGCSSLTEAVLPSATSIGAEAFTGCSSLQEIVLSDFTQEEVEENYQTWGIKGGVQVYCSNGAIYTTPSDESFYIKHDSNNLIMKAGGADDGDAVEWTGGSLVDASATGVGAMTFAQTDMSTYAPTGMPQPSSVVLANATSIGEFAFMECSRLSSISMSRVQTIGQGAFYRTGIQVVDMPALTSLGGMVFGECPYLSTVNLPALSAGGIASNIPMFYNNSNLVSLNLSSIDKSIVEANASTWGIPYGCTVECANGDTYVRTVPHGSGTSSPALVYDNSNYLAGVKADSNYNTSVRDNKWEWVENGNSRTAVVDENEYTDYWGLGSDYRDIDEGYAMGIASEAFSDYRPQHQGKPLGQSNNLRSIKCDNVLEVQDYAFEDCSGLTSVNLPSATLLSYGAFYGCTNLASVTVPNVQELKWGVFYNCSSLTTLALPNATSIYFNVFTGTGLTTLDLSSISMSDVQNNAKDWGIPRGCTVTCSDGFVEIES